MKQVIVARADVGMSPGKLAAQVAHAAVSAADAAADDARRAWKRGNQKKVVLRCADEAELRELAGRAERAGVPYAVITDAGHTELEPGTVTTLGVGPAADDRVDAVTGHLDPY